MTRAAKYALLALFTITFVSLRLIHLGSDPPSWLSWSTGIYSDEGIYACDARSVTLFHRWSPGDFHSAEITPFHHFLLIAVFRLLGVSLVSVRLVSVVASLATLVLFYLSLKEQFDQRTAVIATLFLGLSPVVLFYNRLGLLETPTVLLVVIALYFATAKRIGWLSGIALGLAVCYKPLALFCIPGLFLIPRKSPAETWQRLAGILATLALYFVLWQLPHASDLSRMNRYYLLHQYMPSSISQLGYNIVRSCWSGSSDGIFPYLAHHAAILTALTICAAFQKASRSDRRLWSYGLWLIVSLIALTLMSKEPSRYFLLFWPALAAISAAQISRLSAPFQRTILSCFCLLSLINIVPTLVQPTYLLQSSGRRMGRMLPPSEVVEGQYAPQFGLSNSLTTIYVQPGLANDHGPIDGRLILITESPYWSNYWAKRSHDEIRNVPAVSYHLPHKQVVTGWTIKPK